MTLEQLDLFYDEAISVQSKYSEEGVVFTPIKEAEQLIKATLSRIPKNGTVRILEPSSGTGNLVLASINVFKSRGISPKRIQIVSCELNAEYLKLQRRFIKENYPEWEKSVTFKTGDFLEESSLGDSFDFVVMNPPWVGYRNISMKTKQLIKSSFSLSGQFDLLDPFVIKCFQHLKEDGKMAMFLPDKVISSHQPSNSIDIVRPFCSKFSFKQLSSDFFAGVQHESVFVSVEKGRKKLIAIDAPKNNSPRLGDFFDLFRGFEISGRSSEYLVGDSSKALDPRRPFVSGQEISDAGKLEYSSPRYISKRVPESLIKDHFKYEGPAILVRKTGSPVRVAYVDKLPHVSQVIFVIVPREPTRESKNALKALAKYLQSSSGQKQLAGNSGKLGRTLFPYITISDIKNVTISDALVAELQANKAA